MQPLPHVVCSDGGIPNILRTEHVRWQFENYAVAAFANARFGRSAKRRSHQAAQARRCARRHRVDEAGIHVANGSEHTSRMAAER